MISAAAFFSLKTLKDFPSTSDIRLDLDGVQMLSWGLFLLSTILFFCATAYRNFIDGAGGYRGQPAEDILDEWEKAK
jgi:hypothetical protein